MHRSDNGGQRWETISPDLTTNKDTYQNIPGGPVQHDHTGVELYTTIFSFEESPHRRGELWAGTDDGLLHISDDGGLSWREITPPGMPAGGTVNTIELSPHAAGRALISVYRYRENDFKPYVFLTDDHGKNWKKITNGIPEDKFVRVVREDPGRRGLLYAGTEFGMYFSFDSGENWFPLQLNLPYTPITDMVLKEGDLVVATQGRSFWILDDLSPLHALSDSITQKAGHLFAPDKAYRTQLGGSNGTGAPPSAPTGALIYFWLAEDPDSSSSISLSILDSEGRSHRTYAITTSKMSDAENMKVKAGLNRLHWDLKYEAPEPQPGSVFSLANMGGIKAPPGAHTVELEVNGSKMTAPLQLELDPRWTQQPEALREQYELARQVKDLFDQSHRIIGQIRSVRSQIKGLQSRVFGLALSQKIKDRAKSLLDKLEQLENELIQTKSESGQDPINYPSKLDDQIAYLYSVVNAMDDRPTEGAYLRYENLKEQLESQETIFNDIVERELVAFNNFLRENQVQVIMVE